MIDIRYVIGIPSVAITKQCSHISYSVKYITESCYSGNYRTYAYANVLNIKIVVADSIIVYS